jgi:hypothetical protein
MKHSKHSYPEKRCCYYALDFTLEGTCKKKTKKPPSIFQREWAEDERRIEAVTEYLQDQKVPNTLLIFPEGTDLHEKVKSSFNVVKYFWIHFATNTHGVPF